jgi:hypothetical protein
MKFFFVEAKCGRQIGVSGAPLVRPADGDIDSTVANDAEGARLIVDISARLAMPARPVVVVAGGDSRTSPTRTCSIVTSATPVRADGR